MSRDSCGSQVENGDESDNLKPNKLNWAIDSDERSGFELDISLINLVFSTCVLDHPYAWTCFCFMI